VRVEGICALFKPVFILALRIKDWFKKLPEGGFLTYAMFLIAPCARQARPRALLMPKIRVLKP
jgi:hypothetical protein